MYTIPADRLPPGFAERVGEPPADPATPRPAATVVLLRDGKAGPELLLLRRHRSSGFVPGAYVFPGGTVDDADAAPRLREHSDGGGDEAPGLAHRNAAIREVFEETGVLLARDARGRPVPDAAAGSRMEEWRGALLDERATLLDLVEGEGLRLADDALVHCARWITPIVEPRRYDAHFFLAHLPEGCAVCVDPREMTDAVWHAPAAALEAFRAGRLPMVFPTVKTIEMLADAGAAGDAGTPCVTSLLDAFRGRTVTPILPRLVRTADGVGIVIDDEDG